MSNLKFYVTSFLSICLLFSLVFVTKASPPPEEVKERKKQAPLHVIGEVEADRLLEVLSDERDDPSQLRTMAIKVEKIFKKPADLNLEVGESLSVTYVYIPKWVARAGSATVDIMPGDQFEIWLEPGERGWQPVLGGNTVEHLYRVQPRQEPIPEPFFHKVERNKMLILRNTLIAFMVVGVVLVMIRAAVLWRRMD